MIRTRPLSRAVLGLALLAATTALVTGTTSPGASPARAANGWPTPGRSSPSSFAIEHPSEPNYLDLFSGSNQGVTDDSCPHTFSTDNIGAELIGAGLSFAGYSDGLPSVGSTTCSTAPSGHTKFDGSDRSSMRAQAAV